MRVAAIDLGSNSFHLVIADVKDGVSFEAIDSDKEMVCIGRSIQQRELSEKAMSQGMEAIKRFKKMALFREVEPNRIIVYATSAIREARNGGAYIERIQEETKLTVEVISGQEEARLIYLAVRRAIDLTKERALIIDVGGGSIEFVIGNAEKIFYADSRKLGVLRLLDNYAKQDPMPSQSVQALESYLTTELKDVKKNMEEISFDIGIGSSGTALSIGRMIMARQNEQNESVATEGGNLNGFKVSYDTVKSLRDKVVKMSANERAKIKGLDEKRVSTVVVGLILYTKLMEVFNLKNITLSESALREGMVIDYYMTHLETFRLANEYSDPRRRSVIELGRKCFYEEEREKYVAKLSLVLFDQLKKQHRLSDKHRELLEFSAMLHNVGSFICKSSHHKHSHYIISNAGLQGFSTSEISIIANVARYHRKSEPKKTHTFFQSLTNEEKKIICILGGILKIATSLDRSRRQVVEKISIDESNDAFHLSLWVNSDAEIELWAANHAKGLFEKTFGKKVGFIISNY